MCFIAPTMSEVFQVPVVPTMSEVFQVPVVPICEKELQHHSVPCQRVRETEISYFSANLIGCNIQYIIGMLGFLENMTSDI